MVYSKFDCRIVWRRKKHNSGELDENNTVGKNDIDNFLNKIRIMKNGSD